MHWLQERIRAWKWVFILGFVVLFGPGLTYTAIAQNGRGGEMALRTGCPIFCCSDINMPDIGPGGAIAIIIIFVLIVVALCVMDRAEAKNQREKEEAHQRKLAEDALKYPQLQGKKVTFTLGETVMQGVVTAQDEDRITISFLTDIGTLCTLSCKCGDVTAT
jgi:hypothetical protein